jgi:hypothetical protein
VGTDKPLPLATQRFRRNVRTFYAWLLSMVMLMAGPLVGEWLLDRGTVAARVAAVVLGLGSMVPWGCVLIVIIRRGDEFARRLHLVGAAAAFGGAVLITTLLAWLERGGFVEHPDLRLLVGSFFLVWVGAVLGAKFYFERTA